MPCPPRFFLLGECLRFPLEVVATAGFGNGMDRKVGEALPDEGGIELQGVRANRLRTEPGLGRFNLLNGTNQRSLRRTGEEDAGGIVSRRSGKRNRSIILHRNPAHRLQRSSQAIGDYGPSESLGLDGNDPKIFLFRK